MAFLESDQDYLDAGVAPPEHNPTQVPGDDNDGLTAVINATGIHVHKWAQHGVGGDIECVQGQHPHGHRSRPTQLLTGTDKNGAPVFKTLDF